MTEGMQQLPVPLREAFDELLRFYRLLGQENELLREQLRRHPAGELQIREVERRMAALRGDVPAAIPQQLADLMAARPE
jgi:hypothetical protein